MESSIFLTPYEAKSNFHENQLGNSTYFYKKEQELNLTHFQVAILGVTQSKFAKYLSVKDAPNVIRQNFYQLYNYNNVNLIDLGNIIEGNTEKDTNYALSQVIAELLKNNVTPLILGGTQELTFANYLAYCNVGQIINLVTINNIINYNHTEEESGPFLNKILYSSPNYLFNYANIGHQQYLNNPTTLKILDQLYFDLHRLGSIQDDIKKSEPILRNADMVSVDLNAIRKSEFWATEYPNPNGFYGDQLCQIARYSGMSDKLSSFGLYNMIPEFDKSGTSAALVAQIIWCFLDGFANRKSESPLSNKEQYLNYRVSIQDYEHEITFIKSKKSDRWWMKVPYPASKKMKLERHHLIPCNYNDYENASRNEIPDLWIKTYRKLNSI